MAKVFVGEKKISVLDEPSSSGSNLSFFNEITKGHRDEELSKIDDYSGDVEEKVNYKINTGFFNQIETEDELEEEEDSEESKIIF